jgi:hypothetical protein
LQFTTSASVPSVGVGNTVSAARSND